MPGHTTGDRVDRILHRHTVFGELVCKFLQRMLGARHCKTVAWNNNQAFGVTHHKCGIVGRPRSDGPLGRSSLLRSGRLRTETPEDHAEEGAVHRLAHDVTQNCTRGSHERARDDQHRVVERKADARRGPSAVGIEHRNHHRHVGATDRDNDQHAEHKGQSQHEEKGRPVLVGNKDQPQSQHAQTERKIDHVLAGKDHRGALKQAELVLAGKFPEGNDRAREGNCAHEGTHKEFKAVAQRYRLSGLHNAKGCRLGNTGNCDKHRRKPDHGVHESNQFGHLRHFHPLGHPRAQASADDKSREHPA